MAYKYNIEEQLQDIKDDIKKREIDMIRNQSVDKKARALKNDARDGKVGRHYIHPSTIRGLGAAHYAGELKYGSFNFTKGHKASQLIGAILDHAAQWAWGEDLDKDCTDRAGISVSHLDCILANVNMLKTQLAEGTLIDDRYIKETANANLPLVKQGNE